jgi:Domain of unknown function (DUF4129)
MWLPNIVFSLTPQGEPCLTLRQCFDTRVSHLSPKIRCIMPWLEFSDALAVIACGIAAAQTLGLHPLGWVACVLFGLMAWQFKRTRWYGLTLLWCPGVIGFLASNTDPLTRAWAALLGMFGFYAIWCVLRAGDENSSTGWWTAALLVIWQPSSFALLGITFLAAQATTRWRLGLAPARGAAQHSSIQRWLDVATLALAVFASSLLLPAPAAWRVQDILLPRLELTVPKTSSSFPQADFSARTVPFELGRFDPRPIVIGILILGAVLLAQSQTRSRFGKSLGLAVSQKKKPKAKFDWLLVFVLASVLVMLFVFWTIRTLSSRVIPLQVPTMPAWFSSVLILIFALSLVAALFYWVRIFLAKRAFKPIEPISFPGKRRNVLELPENRVRAAYALWLRLLDELELPRDGAETPFEFSRRVSVHHPNLREATQVLTEAYQRVRYGSSMTETDALRAEEALLEWRSSVVLAPTDDRVTSLTLEKPLSLLD